MKNFVTLRVVKPEEAKEFNKCFSHAAIIHAEFVNSEKANWETVLTHYAHCIDLDLQRFLGSCYPDYPVSLFNFDLSKHLKDAAEKVPAIKEVKNIDLLIKVLRAPADPIDKDTFVAVDNAANDIAELLYAEREAAKDNEYTAYKHYTYEPSDVDMWFEEYQEAAAIKFREVFGFKVTSPTKFMNKFRFEEYYGE